MTTKPKILAPNPPRDTCYLLQNVPRVWKNAAEVMLHVEELCDCPVLYAVANATDEHSWLVKFDPANFNTSKCKTGFETMQKLFQTETHPFVEKVFGAVSVCLDQSAQSLLDGDEALFHRVNSLLDAELHICILKDRNRSQLFLQGDFYQVAAAQNLLLKCLENLGGTPNGNSALNATNLPRRNASRSRKVVISQSLFDAIQKSNQLNSFNQMLQVSNASLRQTPTGDYELNVQRGSEALYTADTSPDSETQKLYEKCRQFSQLLAAKTCRLSIPIPPVLEAMKVDRVSLFDAVRQFGSEHLKNNPQLSYEIEQPTSADAHHVYIKARSSQQDEVKWAFRLFLRRFALDCVSSQADSSRVWTVFERRPIEQIYQLTGKSSVAVCVYDGDITKLCVEATTNAANSLLNHGAGVAFALSTNAGPSLQRECNSFVAKNGPIQQYQVAETNAYELPCEVVLHVVGPNGTVDSDVSAFKSHLRDTFRNLFRYAAGRRVRSIGVPLISSGMYAGNFSKDLCAEAMWEALFASAEAGELGALAFVCFVNQDFDKSSTYAIIKTAKKFADKLKQVDTAPQNHILMVSRGQDLKIWHPLRHAEALTYQSDSQQDVRIEY